MNLAIFNFDGAGLRSAVTVQGPVFAAIDVCQMFGDTNHRRSVARLDSDERLTMDLPDSLGRLQPTTMVNESGLYSLLFWMQPKKARKDGVSHNAPHVEARVERLRKFKKWVTSEVLPSIRKTGSYTAQPENDFTSWAITTLRKVMAPAQLMEALLPLNRFGSLAKSGIPRLGFRRCSYTTTRGRSATAIQVSEQEAITRRMLAPELPGLEGGRL